MKESEDNEKEDLLVEKEDIIIDTSENAEEKMSKEINISIYDHSQKKKEKYKLINESDDLLFCKEEIFSEIKSQNENKEIKIKELYKGQEGDSFFYINKKEIKKDLMKDSKFEEENEETTFDNENNEEMEKIYKEVQLKHPRQIIDGEIKKYPFFSWSGFFCCNKPEYLSLGLGFITYFNTIKLLILIFFLLAIVNTPAIAIYSRYKSIFDRNKNDTLLRTTLGNTLVEYLNITSVFSGGGEKNISFLCSEGKIGEIILIKRYYDMKESDVFDYGNLLDGYDKTRTFTEEFIEVLKNCTNNRQEDIYHDEHTIIEYNNLLFQDNCTYKNFCEIKYTKKLIKKETEGDDKTNYYNKYQKDISDVFIYSCIPDNSNYKLGDQEPLNTALGVSFVSLILIFIFYITYNKSVSHDKKLYTKNKIYINDYTLILHGLKFNSQNYSEELNDLIPFLDNIIEKSNIIFVPNDIKAHTKFIDLNIFDISISHVNQKKIKAFEKIKSFQDKIKDIETNNDTIKNKLKNSLKGVYNSMQNIVTNLKDKNKDKDKEEKFEELKDQTEDNKNIITNDNISESLKERKTERISEVKIKKINTHREKIKEEWNNITIDINKLHEENKLSYYADLYITFKNPVIAKYIYQVYKKGKLTRLYYKISCQNYKLSKYYYKNQWLNFKLTDDSPSDIQWENCYISTKMKWTRRTISFIISFTFIMVITAAITAIKYLGSTYKEEVEFLSKLVSPLCVLVSLFSGILLEKLTKFEKYSCKTKDLFWDITKYYWMNFLVSGVTIQFYTITPPNPIFAYDVDEKYLEAISIAFSNMYLTIITSQLSPVVSFLLNILKRFGDSKYNNGRTTKLTDKTKYEKIYLGPEFPVSQRYSAIFVNFCICLLYGTYCPVMYYFFLLFLIVTFVVDKFLLINYYRKPPIYGSFIARRARDYWMWGVFIFIYGVIFHISNPNLFNYELLKENLSGNKTLFETIFFYIYYILFPISAIDIIIVYFLFQKLFKTAAKETLIYEEFYSFLYFNFKPILLLHFIVFIFFLEPISIIRKIVSPKMKNLSYLNSTSIEIGTLYSSEDLKKYYEIKKLQLANLIIELDKKGLKNDKDNYSHIINNNINVLNYLRHNMEKKSDKKEDSVNIIETSSKKKEDENTELKKDFIEIKNEYILHGDISYNQSFIPKYDFYSNFTLLNNI